MKVRIELLKNKNAALSAATMVLYDKKSKEIKGLSVRTTDNLFVLGHEMLHAAVAAWIISKLGRWPWLAKLALTLRWLFIWPEEVLADIYGARWALDGEAESLWDSISIKKWWQKATKNLGVVRGTLAMSLVVAFVYATHPPVWMRRLVTRRKRSRLAGVKSTPASLWFSGRRSDQRNAKSDLLSWWRVD